MLFLSRGYGSGPELLKAIGFLNGWRRADGFPAARHRPGVSRPGPVSWRWSSDRSRRAGRRTARRGPASAGRVAAPVPAHVVGGDPVEPAADDSAAGVEPLPLAERGEEGLRGNVIGRFVAEPAG